MESDPLVVVVAQARGRIRSRSLLKNSREKPTPDKAVEIAKREGMVSTTSARQRAPPGTAGSHCRVACQLFSDYRRRAKSKFRRALGTYVPAAGAL
jgi:hypothetical protein